ncbi:ATP-grasp domain-containing protein [Marinicella meishanensis]|uniref:ATP-grasp domain-containing protein n=1 Tax=Marinicella meishanensis TaxID=2873263 RepID=UPI001CBD5843|nr:hypothetical protein [Marinicella sp. NBU2979]
MKLAVATCQHFPHGVDDDAPLIDALHERFEQVDVLPWDTDADWSVYQACLLRSVWDYHEQVARFNRWVDAVSQQTRLFNPPAVIHWNQNKYYLAELAEFGITVAPTHWLRAGSQAAQSLDLATITQAFDAPQYFLKPVVGADSSGTLRFEHSAAGLAAAEKHLAQWLPAVDMMLQPYLSTVESHGETSAIYVAGNLTHAVRKIPVKGDFRVQDTFGASDVSHRMNASEMALSKACLQYINQRFGAVLYARFDFLQDAAGCVYLNEAELIEPSMFFNHGPQAAEQLAEALLTHLRSTDDPAAVD